MFSRKICTSLRIPCILSQMSICQSNVATRNCYANISKAKAFRAEKEAFTKALHYQYFGTSATNMNTFRDFPPELDSNQVRAGKRMYFQDLKKEDGQLFVKLKEKSNNKQVTLFFEFSKLPEMIEALKHSLTPEPFTIQPSSYATIKATYGKNKTIQFFGKENDNGKFVMIKCTFDSTLDGGDGVGNFHQLLIPIEYVPEFVAGLEKFASYEESTETL